MVPSYHIKRELVSMGRVYRVGTFRVPPVKKIGNPAQDHAKAMGILKALAGVMEKSELLKQYPELGIEWNGSVVKSEEGRQ
jgi:hypothetical protein